MKKDCRCSGSDTKVSKEIARPSPKAFVVLIDGRRMGRFPGWSGLAAGGKQRPDQTFRFSGPYSWPAVS